MAKNGNMKMKLAVLMALTLVACEKHEAPAPAAESPAAATPVPAAATPVAVAPPSDVAPEGIFFLTEKVSIETSDGIIGFKPGEPVKVINGSVYATQDGTKLTLKPGQVTNSISRAQALLANDARAQAMLAQQRAHAATPTPVPLAAQRPLPQAQPQPMETPASSRPVPTASSLGADSVHNKTRTYYDYGLHKYVTVHVD